MKMRKRRMALKTIVRPKGIWWDYVVPTIRNQRTIWINKHKSPVYLDEGKKTYFKVAYGIQVAKK